MSGDEKVDGEAGDTDEDADGDAGGAAGEDAVAGEAGVRGETTGADEDIGGAAGDDAVAGEAGVAGEKADADEPPAGGEDTVAGEADAVARLISWLKRGPRWASVRTVTVTDLRAGCLESRRFEITG